MAERKSGPVKPPVIDLTARQEAPEPAKKAAREPVGDAPGEATTDATTAKPAANRSANRSDSQAMPILPLAAALAGAVAGAVLSLILAYAGAFPRPDADPRIDALEQRLSAMARPQDAARLERLEAELAALKAAPGPDLVPLQAEIEALGERITALPAPSADGTGTVDPALAGAVAALTDRLAAAEAIAQADKQALAGLATQVAALQQQLAEQREAASAAARTAAREGAQLPALVAGLDTALATGRAFGGELAQLRGLLPDLAVPDAVATSAESGLPTADALVTRFRQALPELAGALPTDPNAPIQDQALGFFRNLLALRPSEEIAGDTPEAVLSRLEAAIERRDFRTAAPLFAQLPEPMLAAAGDLPQAIATRAEAETLLDGLKARLAALPAPEVTP